MSPAVAIIVAVRNEEENVGQALKSVCELNYSNYQVIVVNDRSTDGTAEILKQLAAQYPHLEIQEVDKLPHLWLGKNHALFKGSTNRKEEWLLFTDADVVFDPGALNRAMKYCFKNKLDHLTILPDVHSRSTMLNSVLATFKLMLCIRLQPWAAKNPRSDASIGVGAFNLIRRTAYETAGTHAAIKNRPDDDLMLGALLKRCRFRQDVLYGDDQIKLEWYPGIREFVDGLMKNTFAVSNYNVAMALSGGTAVIFFFSLPVPAGLLSGSSVNVLLALCLLAIQWLLFLVIPGRKRWWDFLMIPFSGALMSYIIFKSTFLTLQKNGIHWRGTFFSLDDLRKND